MTRINLLPWREERRRERQRNFFIAMGVAIAVALGIVGYAYLFMEAKIEHQQDRNRFMEQEIAKLNRKIGEIAKLEQQRKALLDRINIIQRLQASRPEMVHLFDEIPRIIPDGVYLTSLKQTNRTITLRGVAQSNARVSSFMRRLNNSAWLTDPQLKIIKTIQVKLGLLNQRMAEFELTVTQINPQVKTENPDEG